MGNFTPALTVVEETVCGPVVDPCPKMLTYQAFEGKPIYFPRTIERALGPNRKKLCFGGLKNRSIVSILRLILEVYYPEHGADLCLSGANSGHLGVARTCRVAE